MKNPRVWQAVAGLLACFVATTSQAATYTWSGGSSGSGDAWRQANNWNPSSSQGGPSGGDIAVFGTNGSATSIGINFNDGRGLTNPVAAIVLASGPDRTVFNSAPNAPGTVRIEGAQGLLLGNYSAASLLTLRHGASSRMRIDLVAGGRIHVASATAGVVLDGEVGGTHGFTKTGDGYLRLTQSNSLVGPVVVSGGKLELAGAAGASLGAASMLRIESGAVAELLSARQFGGGMALELAGGTLRGAGGPAAVAEQAGALTLSATSTIDLRASRLLFGNSTAITWDSSATLTITNWRAGPDSGLFFGVGGLTSSQLAQIYFADLGVRGAQLVGPQGELVPIPEAPVVAGAAALVALICWRERRRWQRWSWGLASALVGKGKARPGTPVSCPTESSPRG